MFALALGCLLGVLHQFAKALFGAGAGAGACETVVVAVVVAVAVVVETAVGA